MAQLPPQHVGRYDIDEPIGLGAMGTVYRAHDPRIGRVVAIKVLRVDDDELRRRFQQEVRSAGTLTHPNIVTIHDYGDDGAQPFIVMEYLEGRTLAEMLRERHPLTLAEKVHLLEQLCSALDYAHDRGIIHRDIKPANLMVCPDGTLKVLDFGLARIGDTQMTRTGVVVGTLKYMSPEQIEAGAIDRRTDIFSVGVVAYELLSSHHPFPGDTPSRVLYAILNDQPPPLLELCPDLDPEFERIVATAIQKDPSRRYATLRQLAGDLKRINPAAGRARDTVPTDLGARRARNARIAALSLLVAVGVTAGLLFWRAPQSRSTDAMTVPSPAASAPTSLAPATPVPTATTAAAQPATPPALPERTVETPPPGGSPPGVSSSQYLESSTQSRQTMPNDQGRGVPAAARSSSRPPQAPALLQQACDQRQVNGCIELAQMYQRGAGVVRDEARASVLYGHACDLGDGGSCIQAALIYRDGPASVRNLSESAKWWQRACDSGERQGCGNLGVAYWRGDGVVPDAVRAVALFQRACDAGMLVACGNLGKAYQHGNGVARDEARARSIQEKACEAGLVSACIDYGFMLAQGRGGAPNEARAFDYFLRACDANLADGCINLAIAYLRGRVVKQDEARAASLYERACDAASGTACARAAEMYFGGRGVPRDEVKAIGLLDRACNGGVAESCRQLAERYEEGRGVDRNSERAAALRQRATQRSSR